MIHEIQQVGILGGRQRMDTPVIQTDSRMSYKKYIECIFAYNIS